MRMKLLFEASGTNCVPPSCCEAGSTVCPLIIIVAISYYLKLSLEMDNFDTDTQSNNWTLGA